LPYVRCRACPSFWTLHGTASGDADLDERMLDADAPRLANARGQDSPDGLRPGFIDGGFDCDIRGGIALAQREMQGDAIHMSAGHHARPQIISRPSTKVSTIRTSCRSDPPGHARLMTSSSSGAS